MEGNFGMEEQKKDVIKTKQELRKLHKAKRDGIPYEERLSKSQDITESVVSAYDFLQAKHVLVYAAYGSEVITKGIIEYAFMLKKKVYCPRVLFDGSMEFYEITSYADLAEGYKGILEPLEDEEKLFIPKENEKSIVLMPGLCFDRQGHRIGYGKGFYDRYLAKTPVTVKMALAFDSQTEETIDYESQDVTYDFLVTELETICLYQDDEL